MPSNYYIGGMEGHEYPDLQVGDVSDPARFFCFKSRQKIQDPGKRY